MRTSAILLAMSAMQTAAPAAAEKPRARQLGVEIGPLPTGQHNAITDVAGVTVGHRTVIATPAGRVFINPTGNPGMATAGTGDVLTGMVAAWLAQLLDAEAACRIAVFLHGAAGDLAEAECGQVAMTATDLLDRLGDAVTSLLNRGHAESSE